MEQVWLLKQLNNINYFKNMENENNRDIGGGIEENEISHDYNKIKNEMLRCETVDYQKDIKKWMEDVSILEEDDGSLRMMSPDTVPLVGMIEVMNHVVKETGKKVWAQFYDRKIEITPTSSAKKEKKTIVFINNQY